VLADLKTENFIEQAQLMLQKDAVLNLPEQLRAHLDFLETKYVHINGCFCMRAAVKNNRYSVSDDMAEKVKNLHDKHVEQRDMISSVSLEIYALLRNCNTAKQAHQLLPESLHKYIPKETERESTATALVTENLSDLIKKIGLRD